ncbi:response regulator transcription factor [Micrococcus terreus]|uniref:response regulator transcription factor n=1 Tax=Micrococcus terreus TaxID=574650 RepID=UPI003D734A61
MDERRVAVVIEDDEDIRSLLTALLSQSGFTVHESSSGLEGVQTVRDHDPDVVTVDLGLADIDGFEVTRRLRVFSDAHVMVLTARTEEIDALMGLDAGADDYLTKPFRPRELRARVEASMRRRRASARPVSVSAPSAPSSASAPDEVAAPLPATPEPERPAAASSGTGAGSSLVLNGLEVNPQTHQTTVDGQEVALTPTEFLLLRSLLASGQVVRTKAELYRILRDEDPDQRTFVSQADERTVEVHLGNLRRKLGDDPRIPRWIQTVRGVGYRTPARVTRGS